jgi:hypothetical protein
VFQHATVNEDSTGHSDVVFPMIFGDSVLGLSATGGCLVYDAPLEEELTSGSHNEFCIEITLNCSGDASCFDEEG